MKSLKRAARQLEGFSHVETRTFSTRLASHHLRVAFDGSGIGGSTCSPKYIQAYWYFHWSGFWSGAALHRLSMQSRRRLP